MPTHFIVQPFEKKGRKIVQGTPKQEKSESAAIATAERLSERYVGVIAYAVDFDDEDVGEPRTPARHGTVPDED